MLLVTADALVEELGFDAMTDIKDAATGALHAATTVIEARLGTVFQERENVDRYYVNEPGYLQANSFVTEFRLTQGFVQEITRLVRAPAVNLLGHSSAISYPGDVILDKEKGKVTDYTTFYSRHFVEIGYKAGFPVDFANEEAYDQEIVPEWLKQVAKLKATLLLSDHPVMTQSQIQIDTRTLNQQVELILTRNVRYTPVAMLPL